MPKNDPNLQTEESFTEPATYFADVTYPSIRLKGGSLPTLDEIVAVKMQQVATLPPVPINMVVLDEEAVSPALDVAAHQLAPIDARLDNDGHMPEAAPLSSSLDTAILYEHPSPEAYPDNILYNHALDREIQAFHHAFIQGMIQHTPANVSLPSTLGAVLSETKGSLLLDLLLQRGMSHHRALHLYQHLLATAKQLYEQTPVPTKEALNTALKQAGKDVLYSLAKEDNHFSKKEVSIEQEEVEHHQDNHLSLSPDEHVQSFQADHIPDAKAIETDASSDNPEQATFLSSINDKFLKAGFHYPLDSLVEHSGLRHSLHDLEREKLFVYYAHYLERVIEDFPDALTEMLVNHQDKVAAIGEEINCFTKRLSELEEQTQKWKSEQKNLMETKQKDYFDTVLKAILQQPTSSLPLLPSAYASIIGATSIELLLGSAYPDLCPPSLVALLTSLSTLTLKSAPHSTGEVATAIGDEIAKLPPSKYANELTRRKDKLTKMAKSCQSLDEDNAIKLCEAIINPQIKTWQQLINASPKALQDVLRLLKKSPARRRSQQGGPLREALCQQFDRMRHPTYPNATAYINQLNQGLRVTLMHADITINGISANTPTFYESLTIALINMFEEALLPDFLDNKLFLAKALLLGVYARHYPGKLRLSDISYAEFDDISRASRYSKSTEGKVLCASSITPLVQAHDFNTLLLLELELLGLPVTHSIKSKKDKPIKYLVTTLLASRWATIHEKCYSMIEKGSSHLILNEIYQIYCSLSKEALFNSLKEDLPLLASKKERTAPTLTNKQYIELKRSHEKLKKPWFFRRAHFNEFYLAQAVFLTQLSCLLDSSAMNGSEDAYIYFNDMYREYYLQWYNKMPKNSNPLYDRLKKIFLLMNVQTSKAKENALKDGTYQPIYALTQNFPPLEKHIEHLDEATAMSTQRKNYYEGMFDQCLATYGSSRLALQLANSRNKELVQKIDDLTADNKEITAKLNETTTKLDETTTKLDDAIKELAETKETLNDLAGQFAIFMEQQREKQQQKEAKAKAKAEANGSKVVFEQIAPISDNEKRGGGSPRLF